MNRHHILPQQAPDELELILVRGPLQQGGHPQGVGCDRLGCEARPGFGCAEFHIVGGDLVVYEVWLRFRLGWKPELDLIERCYCVFC